MIGLDTNLLVRYITHDDARQAAMVTRLIETRLSTENQAHISLVTVAELIWVLISNYDIERLELTDAMAELLCDDRFVFQDKDAVWAALDRYRDGDVDFGDALIAALDRLHGCTKTLTFDKKATRLDGVELLTETQLT